MSVIINIILLPLINLNYKLCTFITPATNLNIAIYNQSGVRKLDIKNSAPSMLMETLPVNISSLISGNTYYVVFQYGSQIRTIQFVKPV